jgi:hypothetical protein
MSQILEANLYPTFDPPVIKRDNTVLDLESYTISNKTTLSLSTEYGVIYYTLDGSDPRMVGGSTNPSIHQLGSEGQIEIDGTTWLKTRVKAGENWSALHEIRFVNPNEDYSNLKVTEIHYHPADSIIGADTVSGKSFEFFELKNTGSTTINLSGVKFTSSVDYKFHDNELLAPKKFYVIASKPKWFYDRHGMVPSGNFEENFSNSTEQVVIISPKGNEIINFTYFDTDPWPLNTDGEGYSLSARLRYPEGSPNEPGYWKASTSYDGSPFADDSGIFDGKEELSFMKGEIAIYPNPTSGRVYLKIAGQHQRAWLEVYSIQGNKVFESEISGNNVFDMDRLAVSPGIFIFKIKSDGRTSVNKISYQP